MEIQDFLVAAVQNIKVLIRQVKSRMSKSNVIPKRVLEYPRPTSLFRLSDLLRRLRGWDLSPVLPHV